MNFLSRLWHSFFPDFMTEGCIRFVHPQLNRGRDLGIPEGELQQMVYEAYRDANPTVLGQAPGSLLRDKIDRWISENSEDES